MIKRLFVLFLLLLLFPPLSALAGGSNEEELTLLNQPQKNAALQPTDQSQELRDIHGPVELKDLSQALIYAAVISLLLLLLLIVILLIKRRKKTTSPPIPPWEIALSELTEARTLLSTDLALQYMNRISLILRKYVESRFAIKSTRQTTREFLHSMNRSSTDPAIRNCKHELQTCLEQCDMAKFAHRSPLQQNMEIMESSIIAFVEKTTPDPESRGKTA